METYHLIQYISDSLSEDRLYFTVPTPDKDIVFEVMWNRAHTDKPWAFTLYRADNWTPCSDLDILDALKEVECDVESFHTQILRSILADVTYMNMRMNQARRLLGDDLIDSSIQEQEDFNQAITEAINELTNINKSSKLTLVKD